jgi:hypothetical protein
MKYNELKDRLPKSWEDVTLKDYQRVMKAVYYWELKEGDENYELQQIDNSLVTISALMDIDVTIIKGYQISEYLELVQLVQWVHVLPEPSKVKPTYIKKDIDITLDNYITFQAVANTPVKALENIKEVVNLFVVDNNSPKPWYKFKSRETGLLDTDKMNMVEVVTLFFFAQKLLTKSLKHTQEVLTKKLLVLKMKQKLGLS